MAREWFTLEQAATYLGVSSRTLRRWIHAGKLHAELRPGPYGQQYLVPAEQLGAVQVIRDVAHAERQHEMDSVPLGEAIGLRPVVLIAGIGTLFAVLWLVLSPVRRLSSIPADGTMGCTTVS